MTCSHAEHQAIVDAAGAALKEKFPLVGIIVAIPPTPAFPLGQLWTYPTPERSRRIPVHPAAPCVRGPIGVQGGQSHPNPPEMP